MLCIQEPTNGILVAFHKPSGQMRPMNFVIHYSFWSFIEQLKPDSRAYVAAFSSRQYPKGYVIATSDGGTDGGTAHSIKIYLSDAPASDDLDVAVLNAVKALEVVQKFLTSKGVVVHSGVLLTAGMADALDQWATTEEISISDLAKALNVEMKAETKQ